MKSIIATIFAMAASAASAQPIAQFNFGFNLDQDGSYEGRTVTIQLNDDKTALVKVQDRAFTEIDEKTITISQPEFDAIRSNVVELANAELRTRHSTIVCMMMPLFPAENLLVARDYDYDTQVFKKPLRIVLSPNGCWLADHVSPKNSVDNNAAYELKGELRALAFSAIEVQ